MGEGDVLVGPKDRVQNEDSDMGTEAELTQHPSPQKPSWARSLGSPPDGLVALNLLLSLHFQGF